MGPDAFHSSAPMESCTRCFFWCMVSEHSSTLYHVCPHASEGDLGLRSKAVCRRTHEDLSPTHFPSRGCRPRDVVLVVRHSLPKEKLQEHKGGNQSWSQSQLRNRSQSCWPLAVSKQVKAFKEAMLHIFATLMAPADTSVDPKGTARAPSRITTSGYILSTN